MSERPEIEALVANKGFVITYSPLRTEVPALDFLLLPQDAQTYEIPPRASLDPVVEAKKVRGLAGKLDVAILMPGRRFDATGTRIGQGGGWYDRFLAKVPREWLRIGFCYSDQFSESPLPRQSWDQVMDYVVVSDRRSGAITLYSSEGEPHHD